VKRVKTQRCYCGKDTGVCAGDNVKAAGVGLTIPHGAPGTDNYLERERLLRQLGVQFSAKRTKEDMMKAKDLRASIKHFPGNRTTPSKRGKHAGARSLRHKPSLHGPVSVPIDTSMADLEAAEAAAQPLQQRATRRARRQLDESSGAGDAGAARSGAAGGRTLEERGLSLAGAMAEASTREMKLLRELEAMKRDNAALLADKGQLQRAATEQTQQVERLEAQANSLRGKLSDHSTKYKAKLAKLTKQLSDADGGHRALTADMLHEPKFGRKCRNYTSFGSAAIFDAFVDCLDADGLLSNVKRTSRCSDEDAADDADGGGSGTSSDDDAVTVAPKPRRRGCLSAKDAIFFVLMRCRTGLDITDIHALFGIAYSTACRYFNVYVSFLRVWLESEFPAPTKEQIERATPESFRKAFPGRKIQMIIDAHEQQCEEPSNLTCRRTVWSDYKHRTTNKFLGACSPCGACTFASTNYGGKCDDRTLTISSGLMDTAFEGWTTLAARAS
jgi:hypothetical protein